MRLYDENGGDALFEQYKLAVHMADKISDRRADANKFFLGLHAALLAFSGIKTQPLILIIGLIFCVLWYLLLQKYKNLNRVKFKIITKLEKRLKVKLMAYEWEVLKRHKHSDLSSKEQFIPLILGAIYFIWILNCVFNLLWHPLCSLRSI